MRTTYRRMWAAAVLGVLVGVVATSYACAGRSVPTTVAVVSDNGTRLVQGVKAIAEAVVAGEKGGAITRNNAIKVMTSLDVLVKKAEDASKYLDVLLKATTPAAQTSAATQVQAALDFISSNMFVALVPISDDTLKLNVAGLAGEVSKTVGIINREILGRFTNVAVK